MSFAGVVGHEPQVDRLRRAVADHRPAGAYLVTGPTGIGKRTLARALSAALLCDDPRDGDACGACPQCVRVAGDVHPDLRVVVRDDDRRDIRTEQVRELCRWLSLRPLMAGRKVARVEGADCLNEHGQNALLKTLEEPPGASVIVLTATRASQLLPTVRSRCQQVRLDPLPIDVVARFLARRDVDAERAAVLAARAEGSPGRALDLAADPHAELRATLLDRLGRLDGLHAAQLSALAQQVAKGPLEAALDVVLGWYRDCLGLVLDGSGARLRNPDAADALAEAAARTTADRLLRQLEIVCDTVDAVDRNANRVLALETMLLALRRLEREPAGSSGWTSRP